MQCHQTHSAKQKGLGTNVSTHTHQKNTTSTQAVKSSGRSRRTNITSARERHGTTRTETNDGQRPDSFMHYQTAWTRHTLLSVAQTYVIVTPLAWYAAVARDTIITIMCTCRPQRKLYCTAAGHGERLADLWQVVHRHPWGVSTTTSCVPSCQI